MNTSVQWMRIGIDLTSFPSYIGNDIEWFQNIPLLEFPRQQYEDCLNEFISMDSDGKEKIYPLIPLPLYRYNIS